MTTARKFFSAIVLATPLIGTACAHETPRVVEEVKSEYQSAKQNSDVSEHASLELYEAEKAVNRLERASNRENELEQLTYLARRRIEIAEEAGEAGAFEKRIKTLADKRDTVRLEAKSSEARRANQRADLSQLEANIAKRQASLAMDRARELQSKVGELKAKETERGVVLTMRDVLFGFDKAELAPGATRSLSSVADFLNEFPDRSVVVEGHTDSVGNEDYNESLSRERARAVAEFLKSHGVEKKRVTAKGFGETKPVAPNENPAGRQENRRVEVILEENQG